MIRIGRGDLVWSYLGLIVCGGINLFLLPFALRLLPVEELGLWYAFSSFQAFANLLDCGFSVTLCRHFTYAWSGAEKLRAQGTGSPTGGEVNEALFVRLYKLSGRIYRLLTALLVLALLPGGLFYTAAAAPGQGAAIPAWMIYLAAVAVNLCCSRFTPALRGVGAIKQSQQAAVAAKAAQFALSALLLLGGWGLVGMSAGYLAGALLSGGLARLCVHRYAGIGAMLKRGRAVRFRRGEQRQMLRAIAPNMARQGAIAAADFLSGRAAVLMIGATLGLTSAASFGLLQQVTSVVTSGANALYNAYLPLFGECRLTGDKNKAKRLFYRAVKVQWGILLAGGICIALFGGPALRLLGSSSALPSWGTTLLYLASAALLNNHLLFGSYIMTGNRVPMCRAYLASAGVTLALQWLALSQFGLGLGAAVAIGGCVQICYNNWKWVLEGRREFDEEETR